MPKSWVVIAMIAVLSSTGMAAATIGTRLSTVLSTADNTQGIVAWVYLSDKGTYEHLRFSVPLSVVSERSIQRRLKVRAPQDVVDYTDLPVDQSYVERIAAIVTGVRQQSRWFNAVSVLATKAQILQVATLPFVKELDLVGRYRRGDSERETGALPPAFRGASPDTLNYGPSLNQVAQIGIPAVHNTGNSAQGIIIGMFDNGVRLPTHEAFSSMTILATYDFVDHKVSVVPNNPSPAFGSHGVNTLSTIGGYTPGQLIGPAFGATFILARTENDSSETPIEEDNWAAGIEWADSLGVEVTSTSLGYLTYDPPYTSWTWEDMNGHTTVITRAADMAVGRGILVFNSAGNEGFNASHNTLIAPADGDSVVAAGAVNSAGQRSYFSSVGPTTSIPPRIKPDIMAQGEGVVVASATVTTGFTYAAGTSFSCPLAAGAGALILKAHPTEPPMRIVEALKATASNTSSPDNLMGWGIINAMAAINYLNSSSVNEPPGTPSSFSLGQNYPNPFNPGTTIHYSLSSATDVSIIIYDVLGRKVRTLVNGVQPASSYNAFWDGMDDGGIQVPSGVYFYRLIAGNSFSQVRSMILLK